MGRRVIRIGARGSNLSLRQTQIVADLLRVHDPGLRIEVVVITTTGDRQLDTPLSLMGGKGVFTEEIESALLNGVIDFAVHSLKDLPVESREDIVIGAITERASVADVLISRSGLGLEQLQIGSRIGTSSLRRSTQLLHLRPDLVPISIRGNVETRIRKAQDPAGEYDAIVLAQAGLDRLELAHVAVEALSLEVMLPAPGQGALAVQSRNDPELFELLSAINHAETAFATTAERAFLSALGGGCSTPVAALGRFDGDRLHLRGRVNSVDGACQIDVEATVVVSDGAAATRLGHDLAGDAIARGAGSLLGVQA